MEGHKDLEVQNKRLQAQVANLRRVKEAERERYLKVQAQLDDYAEQLAKEQSGDFPKGPFPFDGLTFIVAYYNIPRQIERTLISCSPAYQKAPHDKIEVIIADNGSSEPIADDIQTRFPFVSKILRTDGKASPVFALNDAIKHARFSTIAILIDGAHMLTPGVFTNTQDICELHKQPVINVPQYVLGPDSQNLRPPGDYWPREEEELRRLGWPENGYALFQCGLYPGEHLGRTTAAAIESNCLITRRAVLEECGAFDERFDEPGGGFANLELFSRLTNHPDNTYVLLPGEGSFHQDHSGITTGKSPTKRQELVTAYRRNYKQITGFESLVNVKSHMTYGVVRKVCQFVPTISIEYGQAKNALLQQLAKIYIGRVHAGVSDEAPPNLAVGDTPSERAARPPLKPLGILDQVAKAEGVDPKALSYLHFLQRLHNERRPKLYFEIGVDTGQSLSLARCPSIGVDPGYVVTAPLHTNARLIRKTSDKFFEDKASADTLLKGGIDLAFIDGMHAAEYVLRDFINVEKRCNPNSIVVFDDVLPEQMAMIDPRREFNAWTGDVYKIVPILRRYRPDLDIGVFNAFIGPYRKGIAVVSNLDPKNTILDGAYDAIKSDILGSQYDVESIEQLEDMMAASACADFDRFLNTPDVLNAWRRLSRRMAPMRTVDLS